MPATLSEVCVPAVGDKIDVDAVGGREYEATVVRVVSETLLVVDVWVFDFKATMRMWCRHDGNHWMVSLSEAQVAASNAAFTTAMPSF